MHKKILNGSLHGENRSKNSAKILPQRINVRCSLFLKYMKPLVVLLIYFNLKNSERQTATSYTIQRISRK